MCGDYLPMKMSTGSVWDGRCWDGLVPGPHQAGLMMSQGLGVPECRAGDASKDFFVLFLFPQAHTLVPLKQMAPILLAPL